MIVTKGVWHQADLDVGDVHDGSGLKNLAGTNGGRTASIQGGHSVYRSPTMEKTSQANQLAAIGAREARAKFTEEGSARQRMSSQVEAGV